jgi:HlyD family secretion protein
MDQPLPPRRRRRLLLAMGLVLPAAMAAGLLWQAMPDGLQVARAEVRTAVVERGLYRDELLLRASVVPLHSVILDAVESGRVEQVDVRDGALVQQGQMLFRLSNAQRRLESLAREAEHAQHVSNLMNLRVGLELARAERQRRLADLAHALRLAELRHGRNIAMAHQGFLSAAALEESAEHLAQQRRLHAQEAESSTRADATQRDAIRQMEAASARLSAGLRLVQAGVQALAVRAPVAGRLTDFRLQVGETIRLDQHLGRIDDASRFKLTALVDEYYLNRVASGQAAVAVIGGQTHALTVTRVYPQIKDGRFSIELEFAASPQGSLSPGQSLETRITLGGSSQALLLPNDAFASDGDGAQVFVLREAGRLAERRPLRMGRRNQSQIEVLSGLAPGETVIASSTSRFRGAERLELID